MLDFLKESVIPKFVHNVVIGGLAKKLLDILGNDVGLDVDKIANANIMKRGGTLGVRDQGNRKTALIDTSHGQRNALQCHTSLLDNISEEFAVALHREPKRCVVLTTRSYSPGSIDVPRDDVPSQSGLQRQSTFQVYGAPRLQLS